VKGVGGVGLLTGVLAVSAGYEHSLALLSNGTVAAWGDDEWGQLGNGTTTLASSTPTLVLGVSGTGVLSSVKAIAAGELHSLALLSNGTVVAWGHNSAGELGNGTMTAYSSTPVPVKGVGGSGVLSGVVAIAAGAQDSLALLSNGTVVAWGANEYGQLGNGATTTSPTPVQVEGVGGTGVLSGAIAIAAGGYHSLALLTNGTVAAWGHNASGQLGDGTTTDSDTPVLVLSGSSPLSGVEAIAAGELHSLALQSSGRVAAWGDNTHGQLGIDPGIAPYLSKPLTGLLSGVQAITANYADSVALLSNGGALVWGDNTYGQLGNGEGPPGLADNATATQVVGVAGTATLEGVSALAAGSYAFHMLAIQPAFAALSPGALAFAAHVGSSSAGQAASVTNMGAGPLVISGDTVIGSGEFHRLGDSCAGATLAAGASCAITFVFKPTSTGNAHATVAIQSSAANALPSLNLSGDAVAVGKPLPPLPRPRLSRLKLTPETFRAAAAGRTTVAANAKRRPGTLISYTDSQAAATTFTIQLCVARAKQSPHKAAACRRYRTVGRFTHTDIAGLNRLRFTGRISHHKLSAGSYRLLATASTRTETSATRTATFTIKH
jgi:alpha-tubulin suppressor-like RCC1 family protein